MALTFTSIVLSVCRVKADGPLVDGRSLPQNRNAALLPFFEN
jgi:hypothetical protein